MYEMGRKPEPTPKKPTNYHIIKAWCENWPLLHWKLYTAGKWIAAQLNVIAVTGIRTPVPTSSMSFYFSMAKLLTLEAP